MALKSTPASANDDIFASGASAASSGGFYENFLDAIASWDMSIPLQSFWVIIIDFPPGLTGKWLPLLTGQGLDYVSWSDYDVSNYGKLISNNQDGGGSGNQVYGCLYARTLNVPGERIETTIPGYNNNSYLFPSVVKSRTTPAELQISFMETNNSFIDNVIRPWTIATGYAGLVARQEGSIKGTLRAYFYSKYTTVSSPRNTTIGSIPRLIGSGAEIRKSFVFYDVAALSVNSQEYTYVGDALLSRPTTFTYSSYTCK